MWAVVWVLLVEWDIVLVEEGRFRQSNVPGVTKGVVMLNVTKGVVIVGTTLPLI
jgi:hypothetical protein